MENIYLEKHCSLLNKPGLSRLRHIYITLIIIPILVHVIEVLLRDCTWRHQHPAAAMIVYYPRSEALRPAGRLEHCHLNTVHLCRVLLVARGDK